MRHDQRFSNLRLRIEYVPTANLISSGHNPRVHGPRQIKALAGSIDTFGFVAPVIADEANVLIAGEARVLAAKRLGLAEVPVVRVEHLDANQKRALMIADNRLTDMSAWNDELLAENLKILSEIDLDFDIEATGFTTGEIDLRIEGLEIGPDDDPDDGLPEESLGDPVNRVGDLWRLGSHRLLCGDALDARNWSRLMDGKKAAMTCSDFPYNVRINGHVSGLGEVRHGEFPMASGEMDRRAFTTFLETAFRNIVGHSRPGSLHYIFMDWRHLGEMQTAGDAVFSELKNVCVWAKDRAAMGSLYRSRHEMIFVWKAGRDRHRNNVELGRNGRHRTNVWEYPGIGTFRHSDEGDLLRLHPTVKPVRMIADAILDVTARGDIVLDPFLGSGTTIIAAERVGRRAYGMELDPLHADTSIRRYERHSGENAVHVETARPLPKSGKSARPASRAARPTCADRTDRRARDALTPMALALTYR
jgi:DNA modification methylase